MNAAKQEIKYLTHMLHIPLINGRPDYVSYVALEILYTVTVYMSILIILWSYLL